MIDWLLEGPPWVQYRTRTDLLKLPEDDPEVLESRDQMLAHPAIQGLISEISEWPDPIMKNHKDAAHLLHKLAFIADLGLRVGDPTIDTLVERILSHRDECGPTQLLVNIKPAYGGTGEDQWAWMLCDAPLGLYALLKFGVREDERVQASAQHLAGLVRENGWPCAVSPDLGKFRGPGKKADPCPYANLLMLKALAQLPYQGGAAVEVGAETLLGQWEARRERRPYLFAMGSDFGRLKAPLIWYDLLHMLDVLTQFPALHADPRLAEMLQILRDKADRDGRFTPESVWLAWKDWDFGQKRQPSRWLTLIAQRTLYRMQSGLTDRLK